MLAGIDGVDWEAFSDAYGPAKKVAGLLRDLGNGKNPAKTFGELANRIAHQGSLTPAALPAAPFLVELVSAGAEPLGPLLLLIGDLAAGGFHGNFALDPCPEAEAGTDFAVLRSALAEALPAAVRALGHEKADVRACAMIPIAMLGSEKERAALLAAVEGEADAGVIGTALAALGHLVLRLGPSKEAHEAALARRVFKAEGPKLAAALLAALVAPSVATAEALLSIVGKAKEKQKGVRWNEGELRVLGAQRAAQILAKANALSRVLALEEVLGIEPTWSLLLENAFGQRFRRGVAPEPRLASELTAAQWATLEALAPRYLALAAERAADLGAPGPPRDLLQEYGIFGLDRLMGATPPGPRDALTSVRADQGPGQEEPFWRLAFRTRRHHAGRHRDWSAAIASLDFEARLALLRDFRDLRYGHNYPPVLDVPHAAQQRFETALDTMVLDALDGAPSDPLEAALKRQRKGDRWRALVACWVRSLAAEGKLPPEKANAELKSAVDSTDADETIARMVLGPLSSERRDAIAGGLDLDILEGEDGEDGEGDEPPAFRTGWHVVDLVPALYAHCVARIAGRTKARSAWDVDLGDFDDETIERAIDRLARAPMLAKALIPPALGKASAEGRAILERVLAKVA